MKGTIIRVKNVQKVSSGRWFDAFRRAIISVASDRYVLRGSSKKRFLIRERSIFTIEFKEGEVTVTSNFNDVPEAQNIQEQLADFMQRDVGSDYSSWNSILSVLKKANAVRVGRGLWAIPEGNNIDQLFKMKNVQVTIVSRGEINESTCRR